MAFKLLAGHTVPGLLVRFGPDWTSPRPIWITIGADHSDCIGQAGTLIRSTSSLIDRVSLDDRCAKAIQILARRIQAQWSL